MLRTGDPVRTAARIFERPLYEKGTFERSEWLHDGVHYWRWDQSSGTRDGTHLRVV